MNLLRLNALLLANRQSPRAFNMGSWYSETECGTQGCLIGNYALRPDLQSTFSIGPHDTCANSFQLNCAEGYPPNEVHNGLEYHGVWLKLAEHFEITLNEALDLFSFVGCDGAFRDRDKAIAYIEAFIARKLAERPAPQPDEDEDEEEEIEATA